ncbi:MAG: FAD:protein FMN transferase [Erysipelotrichaceae bacterium]|nr:FAD:protein FMN transferase [Erysipelotrichaceae bacterium]
MKTIFLILSIFLLTGCTQTSSNLNPTPTPTPDSSQSLIQESETVTYYMDSVIDIMDEYIPMMNTMVRLKVYRGDAESLYHEAYEVMSKYHKLLDSHHYYRDDEDNLIHNIKIINDSYGSEAAIQVSDEMIEILEEVMIMSKLSQGYFNPFMGALIDLWAPKFSAFPIENTDPETDEIERAKGCVPSIDQFEDLLSIDHNQKTVTFHAMEGCSDKVSINLGAFSKGYIIDKTKERLTEHDAVWLLDAGTSTISAYDPESEKTWSAGVISPYNKVAMMYVLELSSNQCLSTSGDDNQYFLLSTGDDFPTVRCHILNPFTGYSENTYRSCSIITQNQAAVSDVLSTVMFSITDKNLAFEIIHDFEKQYETDIAVSWIRETDTEFKLAAIEATQLIHDAIVSDTIMDAVEQIILLEEPE